jgi:hypothetical protein
MLRAAHPQINSRVTFTRAAICFLLVLLSLYNPFLTVSDACNVLHVHHPLSFRATVASSELRRCTVDDSWPLIADPQALETTDPTPIETQTPPAFPARQDQELVAPPQQVTLAGFWFRPPPSI